MRNIMWALYRKPESTYPDHIYRWAREARGHMMEYRREYSWGKRAYVKRVYVDIVGDVLELWTHKRRKVRSK